LIDSNGDSSGAGLAISEYRPPRQHACNCFAGNFPPPAASQTEKRARVPALKIAIQLKSLRQPLKQALATAQRLGAQGVEIDARGQLRPGELSQTGLRQFRKLLEDLNLRVVAVEYHTRRGYNVEEELEKRVEGTKAAMKLAYDLGASVVVNQIGRVPSEPEGRNWQLLVEVLHDLGNGGQRAGAMLAAETGSESGEDLARLLKTVPAGAVGATLDPGNLIINGFSTLDAVEALGNSILHVHAKDGVRDLAQGRGIEVPLGRGSVDFPALLGALEQRDFRGYYTIERGGGDDPVYEVGQAVQYLQNL
jgi:sugar phosphate isomerase/epimerase